MYMYMYLHVHVHVLPLLLYMYLLTLARTCAAKGYCSRSVYLSVGRSVCLCVCVYLFPRFLSNRGCCRYQTWICGYVGMCNGRSVIQEQRGYQRTACLRRGPKIIYSYYTRCALIRDHRPTAWDGFASPAETEATCIWKVSPQIVVGIFLKVRIMSRVRDSFCERSEEYDVKTINYVVAGWQ